ncbi:MAG: bifunctional glycosyltransferase family 2/GtrA family protein [Spirochaetales bacterium]|nr:bifunctional glycosyltransferase family 2/GtrA family protein [Spirochaetales bacterium]
MHWLISGRQQLYRRIASRYLPYAAQSFHCDNPQYSGGLDFWRLEQQNGPVDFFLSIDDHLSIKEIYHRLSANSLLIIDRLRGVDLRSLYEEARHLGLVVELVLQAGFLVRLFCLPVRFLGVKPDVKKPGILNGFLAWLYSLEIRLHPYVKFITGENTVLVARRFAGEPQVGCELSVVIPAFNEEKRLPPFLKKVERYLAEKKISSEILIVDDGSTDGTSLIPVGAASRIITLYKNFGKGGAVQEGVRQASGELILICDADGSTAIEEMESLRRALDAGFDVAIGSRYLQESNVTVRQSAVRIFISRGGNLLIRLFTGLSFQDTQCGFKLFRRTAARVLFRKLVNLRYGYDFEVLKAARDLQFNVVETPVRWEDKEGSRLTTLDSVGVLLDLFRLRFGYVYRFSFVGVINTAIDYAIHNGLIYFFGMGETSRQVIYQAIGFLFANFISYIFNSGITFRARGEYWKFLSISVVALCLALLAFGGLNSRLNPGNERWLVNVLKLSTVAVSFITNYFGYKLLVFRIR